MADVEKMLADAAADYAKHNDPATAREARDRGVDAKTSGNESAGAWGGSATGTQRDGR